MTARTLIRPDATEYAPFYAGYVAKVPEGDIVALLETQTRETAALLAGLSEEHGEHRYAPDKWTIREVLGHVCDTERVMAYRLMRIARGDDTLQSGEFVDRYRPLPEVAAALALEHHRRFAPGVEPREI